MNTGAIIMMITGCTIVWGGLLVSLRIALKSSNK